MRRGSGLFHSPFCRSSSDLFSSAFVPPERYLVRAVMIAILGLAQNLEQLAKVHDQMAVQLEIEARKEAALKWFLKEEDPSEDNDDDYADSDDSGDQ